MSSIWQQWQATGIPDGPSHWPWLFSDSNNIIGQPVVVDSVVSGCGRGPGTRQWRRINYQPLPSTPMRLAGSLGRIFFAITPPPIVLYLLVPCSPDPSVPRCRRHGTCTSSLLFNLFVWRRLTEKALHREGTWATLAPVIGVAGNLQWRWWIFDAEPVPQFLDPIELSLVSSQYLLWDYYVLNL